MLEYICQYFFIPFLATLALCSIVSILLGIKKIEKLFIPVILLVFLMLTNFTNYYYSVTISICGIILSLYFFLIEKISIPKVIFAYLNALFIILFSDILCGLIIENTFNITADMARNSVIVFTCSNAFVFIVAIILALLLHKFLNKLTFNFEDLYNNKLVKKLLFITIFLLIICFYAYRLFALKYMLDVPYAYLIGAIILLLFIGLVYFYINQTIHLSLKKDFIDKENKQLKEYTQMLETMSSDLRKFKHDYVNILYTLGDFINNGDIEGLKEYYDNDLLPESKKIVRSDKNITLLRNIKITPIKALVSSKLLLAQSEGIEINAEVLEEIDSLSIKTIDICRILGIFLDNAMEASLLCEKKFIHFAMIKTDNDVIIVILNSCTNDVPPVFKLFEKNFSTKGSNRGIGLSNVKELISSHYKNILLNTSCNNGVFKQELIIKDNK